MRQFWAWAVEEAEVPVNPMEAVKQPSVTAPPVEVLSVEQVRALLASCRAVADRTPRPGGTDAVRRHPIRVSALAGAQLDRPDLRDRTVEAWTRAGR
jgi:site-specific recombinase XerC